MKCPSCGYWNRPHYPKCFKCGADLTPQTNAPGTADNALSAAEPTAVPSPRGAVRPFGVRPASAPDVRAVPQDAMADEPDTARPTVAAHAEPDTARPTVAAHAEPDTAPHTVIAPPPVAPVPETAGEAPPEQKGYRRFLALFKKRGEAMEMSLAPPESSPKQQPSAPSETPAAPPPPPWPQAHEFAPVADFSPEKTLKRLLDQRPAQNHQTVNPHQDVPAAKPAGATRNWSTRRAGAGRQEEFTPEQMKADQAVERQIRAERAAERIARLPALPSSSGYRIDGPPLQDMPAVKEAEPQLLPPKAAPAQTPSQEEPETVAVTPPVAGQISLNLGDGAPDAEETLATVAFTPQDTPADASVTGEQVGEPKSSAFAETPSKEPQTQPTTARMLANRRYPVPGEDEDSYEPTLLPEHPRRAVAQAASTPRTFANTPQRGQATREPQGPASEQERPSARTMAQRNARMSSVQSEERAAWGSPLNAQPPMQRNTVQRSSYTPAPTTMRDTMRGHESGTRARDRDLGHVGRPVRPRHTRWGAVLWAGFWMIAVVAVAFGLYKGFLALKAGTAARTPASLPSAAVDSSLPAPRLEETVVDGKAAHVLYFSGNDRDMITIPELPAGKNITILSGVAKFIIPDEMWIGDDPSEEQEYIPVTLHPKLYTQAGVEKAMAEVTYSVPVPLTEMTLLAPSATETRLETYSSTVQVQVRVATGTQVTIGNANVSDLADKSGLISQNVKIEPIGDNFIEVIARVPGHRRNRQLLTIHRPAMEIPIELDIATPEVSSNKTALIRGRTLPGATITVESPISGTVKYDKQVGTFSFSASFKLYGENTVIIRASMSGKADSVIQHRIEYKPTLDEYSRQAWALPQNYDNLTSNPSGNIGRIFVIEGTVRTVERAEKPMLILFDASKSGKEMVVYFEYTGDKKWETGKKMKVYGDVTGSQDGVPLLAARYIFYP